MPRPSARALGCLAVVAFLAAGRAGGCVGAIATPVGHGPAVYTRLPHNVAPTEDSPPFRFAMVHDVVHERYPRHGPAFYEHRERLARERLAVLPRDSEAAFALTDDIAVGLDRRGRSDEAIALMRDKLRSEERR